MPGITERYGGVVVRHQEQMRPAVKPDADRPANHDRGRLLGDSEPQMVLHVVGRRKGVIIFPLI